MGKLFNSGQYAAAFCDNIEIMRGVAKKPWRVAATEQLIRLISQRGGLTVGEHFHVDDERGSLKKLKGSGNRQKNMKLYELWKCINDNESAAEVAKKASAITCGGEEENLAKAIASFSGDKARVADNERLARRPTSGDDLAIAPLASDDDLALAGVDRNPFDIAVKKHPKAMEIKTQGHLPMVPQFDSRMIRAFCPWQVSANPYYSAERAGRHVILQQLEFALWSIGAAVTNQNQHLLDGYHQICQGRGAPSNTELKQQAFYILTVGMRALPTEMVEAGFSQIAGLTRFVTMGTQGLRFPNGCRLYDANAINDLRSVLVGDGRYLTQDFDLIVPSADEVPQLDMSRQENVSLLDSVKPQAALEDSKRPGEDGASSSSDHLHH